MCAQYPNSPNTRLSRLGGEIAVGRLTTLFYEAMIRLPEAGRIRAMHSDLDIARAKLELFLIEWLGGAKVYSQKYGPPGLRMKHALFPITNSDKGVWLACMGQALDQVVTDASLRVELDGAFAQVAGALVNLG